MKAKSLLFAALAMVMAACVPTTDPKEEFVPEFKVSGVKDNTVSVGAGAKDVTVSVTSNLSWSVECAADWVTINPESYTAKEDKTSETVKVKVSVSANEVEEARETELVFGAEGVDPVKVTLRQAAKEHVYKTITVFDIDKFEPVSDYSVEAPAMGGSVSFTVQANGDWTVEAPEWAAVTPASFTYTDNDLATVTVAFEANTADARTGELRFKGDFEADLVVPVSQAVAPAIKATLKSYDYRQAIFDVEAPEGMYWLPVNGGDDEYFNSEEGGGVQGCVDYVLDVMNKLYAQYRDSYSIEEILDIQIDNKGSIADFKIGIEPETQYNIVFVSVAIDGDKYVAGALPAYVKFTSDAAPAAEDAYAALLGTFSNAAMNYGKAIAGESEYMDDIVAYIESDEINKTAYLAFVDGVYFPKSGNNVDFFLGNYVDGTLVFDIPTISDLGYGFWGFSDQNGNELTGAIALNAWYAYTESVKISKLIFTPVEGGFEVSADVPSNSSYGVDYINIEASIFDQAAGDTSYATGCACLLTNTFTRVEETASSSVRGFSIMNKKDFNPSKKFNAFKLSK